MRAIALLCIPWILTSKFVSCQDDEVSDPPSDLPSLAPSMTPSAFPSIITSNIPSSNPTTLQLTDLPTLPEVVPVTASPTTSPTVTPTKRPSAKPSSSPSEFPTGFPTTQYPTLRPTNQPTTTPSSSPSEKPTMIASDHPTRSPMPSQIPTQVPSPSPSQMPSVAPTRTASAHPTTSQAPTWAPSTLPSREPSPIPSAHPSWSPSNEPSSEPSGEPSYKPSTKPSAMPSVAPSTSPTALPSVSPSHQPSSQPSVSPSYMPSKVPSMAPTRATTIYPKVVTLAIRSDQLMTQEQFDNFSRTTKEFLLAYTPIEHPLLEWQLVDVQILTQTLESSVRRRRQLQQRQVNSLVVLMEIYAIMMSDDNLSDIINSIFTKYAGAYQAELSQSDGYFASDGSGISPIVASPDGTSPNSSSSIPTLVVVVVVASAAALFGVMAGILVHARSRRNQAESTTDNEPGAFVPKQSMTAEATSLQKSRRRVPSSILDVSLMELDSEISPRTAGRRSEVSTPFHDEEFSFLHGFDHEDMSTIAQEDEIATMPSLPLQMTSLSELERRFDRKHSGDNQKERSYESGIVSSLNGIQYLNSTSNACSLSFSADMSTPSHGEIAASDNVQAQNTNSSYSSTETFTRFTGRLRTSLFSKHVNALQLNLPSDDDDHISIDFTRAAGTPIDQKTPSRLDVSFEDIYVDDEEDIRLVLQNPEQGSNFINLDIESVQHSSTVLQDLELVEKDIADADTPRNGNSSSHKKKRANKFLYDC